MTRCRGREFGREHLPVWIDEPTLPVAGAWHVVWSVGELKIIKPMIFCKSWA
jgi:hypothetical protein